MDKRRARLEQWAREVRGVADYTLAPASADASFRRYFRFTDAAGSCIVMDAPPEREDSRPYLRVAADLRQAGLHVPEVLAADLAQGFILLSDLGTQTYLDALTHGEAEHAGRLYGDAIDALVRLQAAYPSPETLPPYDERLLRDEMALFREWYLERHLGIALNTDERRLFDEVEDLLCASALAQPRVAVHRDYHSRNLMLSEPNPGILDFQDAVHGPLSYDLVSLLRDCYITWPEALQTEWMARYLARAREAGVCDVAEAEFHRWFDLMGVQRHLKAAGIFARLNYRDGKPGYLDDIPRTLAYVMRACARHEELAGLGRFLATRAGVAS